MPEAAVPNSTEPKTGGSNVLKFFAALIGLLGGFLGYVALKSGDFRYERSTDIAADPAAVFPLINDVHRFQTWSPWSKRDPKMKSTYDGPAAGVGAKHSWVGNSEVGEGQMTVTISEPNEMVRYKLEFKVPFEDQFEAELTLKPDGDQTKVTWSMWGTNNFVGKVFATFMDMEAMIGKDFDEGLANLKREVETAAAKPADEKPSTESK